MEFGSIVRLGGILNGNGQQASCEVLACKIGVQGNRSDYIDCCLIGAPENIPDGDYTVAFENHNLKVTRHRGLWFPRGDAAKIERADATASAVPFFARMLRLF